MILLKLKMDIAVCDVIIMKFRYYIIILLKFISLYLLGEFRQLEEFPSFHISSWAWLFE